MKSPRPGTSPDELTVAYQPAEPWIGRLPVAVATGSGLASEEDVRALLRRRLLFVAVVFAVYLAVVVVLQLIALAQGRSAQQQSAMFTWVTVAASLISGGSAGVLASRARLSLLQLRGCELVLFGALFGRGLYREYLFLWFRNYLTNVSAFLAAGQWQQAADQVQSMAYELHFSWAIYMVAYGVLVPNTWRRCALILTVLALLPPGLWIAACVSHGLPVEHWFLGRAPGGFMNLTVAALLGIYGSYRIDSLQNAAMAARRLGQYILRERLGAGGMGEVYRAEHLFLRRPCAIKLIRPERAGDPAMLQRFEREVQTTSTLTHPNTVQIFDYGRGQDGTFYYVMEYLPGVTLEELVKKHGSLPVERVVHFLKQLCGALAEAHAIGFIHRDIKPGNVMVCERGGKYDVVKLLDFGLVQTYVTGEGDDRLTQQGIVIGTPAFLSPEQADGSDTVDVRSDIYSLGALAYFLLTGQPPFGGRSQVKMLAAHLYELPAPMSAVRADLPPVLEAVVLKCLAKTPADRIPDVRSLEKTLAECDTVKEWSDEDAADWWKLQDGSEARAASSQGREEPGRISR